MARMGTPFLLSLTRPVGASPRRVSAKIMRDEAYRLEFKADSTAVKMMAFMMWAAYGMFMTVRALTKGVAMAGESQGTMQTTTNMDPT